VNVKGEMDETPLHIAVIQRNEDMVQALMKAGARCDLRCSFGDTAIERAILQGGEIGELFTINHR
jgi:uncharacterized protein